LGLRFFEPPGGGRIRRWTAAVVVGAMSFSFIVVGSAAANQVITGKAVFYSNRYVGKTMACGGTYRRWKMITANRHLPCGTRLRVTNLRNGRKVTVKVKDRGPYGDTSIKLDLSRRAAKRLRFLRRGVTNIKARILSN
jgi:rare lipoprotein A